MQGESASIETLQALARDSQLDIEIEARHCGVEITLRDPLLRFHHDFSDGALARRAAQPGQGLLKACNNKKRDILEVLDLTAGWGADGLTLARHGQRVTMLERDPLLYNILAYSLATLRVGGADTLAGRIRILNLDARDFLAGPDRAYDCIYLDPMFPAHKSGAKPAKEMQILQRLASNAGIESCFELALRSASKRVVVKRPSRAESLGGRKPDLVYREKSIRFDVYLTAGGDGR